VAQTENCLQNLNIDIVFPVLHGTFGEEGRYKASETASLPYVGADVLGSAVGMDKEISKRLWLSADCLCRLYLGK
jgi:D-alanine-D-alanine ligase